MTPITKANPTAKTVVQTDDNHNNASPTSKYKGRVFTKATSALINMVTIFKRSVTMQCQHLKNQAQPVKTQENPRYAAEVKTTAPAAAPMNKATPAATENFTPSATTAVETPSLVTVQAESRIDLATVQTPAGQWQIQDIDLEQATKPLPRTAAEPQATPAASALPAAIESEPTAAAPPFVKSELNASAYKTFQKKDTNAREVMRLKHDGLFLAAFNQPAKEGRYSEQLERLGKDYDTAYAPAFAELYAAARQEGHSVAVSLKFAAALATNSVVSDFQASADPARNAYAKVMEKFEQTVTDSESLTRETFTPTITYELAAERHPIMDSKVTATLPKIENRDSVMVMALESKRAESQKMVAPLNPLRKSPATAPSAATTVTQEMVAPLKPPRKSPATAPSAATTVTQEMSLPARSNEAKKSGRTIASLFGSSSQPSVRTMLNQLFRRNTQSTNLSTPANTEVQRGETSGTNVPGLQSFRTNEPIQNSDPKTGINAQLRAYLNNSL